MFWTKEFIVQPVIRLLGKYKESSGPGCSKLTTSLVNVSLKFQTLISQICQYFFVEKMREAFAVLLLLSFFQQKYLYVELYIHKTLNQLTS